MKKMMLPFAFLFLPLAIFAQEYGIGFRAGYNYATTSISEIFTGKDSIPAPSPSGFTGAFLLDLGITKAFSIETQFQYGENETGLTIDSFPSIAKIIENGTITTRLDIPVLGKIRFGSQIFKFNVFAGPNFSFQRSKFSESRVFDIDLNETKIDKVEIDKSSFKSYEYRNIAGFGLSIHLNHFVIFGDYRYIFSFQELDTIRQNGIIEKLGSNIGIGLGYYW